MAGKDDQDSDQQAAKHHTDEVCTRDVARGAAALGVAGALGGATVAGPLGALMVGAFGAITGAAGGAVVCAVELATETHSPSSPPDTPTAKPIAPAKRNAPAR